MRKLTHNRARVLIQIALDQDLSTETQAALEAHLAVCSDCRREAETAQKLDTALRADLPRRYPASALSQHEVTSITRQIRSKGASHMLRPTLYSIVRLLGWLAVAAAFILFLQWSILTLVVPPTPAPAKSEESPISTPTTTPRSSVTPSGVSYTRPEYGFSLTLPLGFNTWEAAKQGEMRLHLGIASPQDSAYSPDSPPLGVAVYANPYQLSLRAFLEQHSGEPTADPASQIYFYDPLTGQQGQADGVDFLEYTSGRFPVRIETLFLRPGYVLGIFYFSDHPQDYTDVYQDMLDSLTWQELVSLPTPVPTPTRAPICVDPLASATTVPDRTDPIEIHFLSLGDVWMWEESLDEPARQITNLGDIRQFWFSPDGQFILLQRWLDQPEMQQAAVQTELWAIQRDGSGLRPLFKRSDLLGLTDDPTVWQIIPEVYRWSEADLFPLITVYGNYEGIGGCCTPYGYWTIDPQTGERSVAPTPTTNIPEPLTSPDGQWQALPFATHIDLADAKGNISYSSALTYPQYNYVEGGGYMTPPMAWTADSQSLMVVLYPENLWGGENTFSTWRVPIDGTPAQKLHEFEGFWYSVSLSANGRTLMYWNANPPDSNQRDLHLALVDGATDVVYDSGYLIDYGSLDRSPDGFHFVYGSWASKRLYLGSLCGNPVPLLNEDMAAWEVTWLDSQRFVFTSPLGDFENSRRELRIASLGEPSLLIGILEGDTSYFVIR
jgi:hypothetical protein